MTLVLGGGLSGLSAAYYLSKLGRKVTLFEASHHIGGWVKSRQVEDNIVFNEGPRTIRVQGEGGPNTIALAEELGLQNHIVAFNNSHSATKYRLIYVNKTLHILPLNFPFILFKKPPFKRSLLFGPLLHDLKSPREILHDDTMYNFTKRRFGKDIADYAVTAIVRGVCAGDAKEISVKFLMKPLFELEQKYGSVIRGMFKKHEKKASPYVWTDSNLYMKARLEKWNSWMFDCGMGVLPQALASSIQNNGGEIHTNTPCNEISFESGVVKVKAGGKIHEATHVISALPASKLAELTSTQHPELSKELAAIQSVTVATVNLHFKGNVLRLAAFGFLVPSTEDTAILGITFDSCCQPCGDNTILTVMMGGKWFEELFGSDPSPDYLLNVALSHVQDILNITESPQNYNVSILKNCIPQYVVGHYDRVQKINEYIKMQNLPLSLIGASYNGIGVNDVILNSRKVVDEFVNKT